MLENTTIILESGTIPIDLWIILFGMGLVCLLLSLILYDRSGMMTGLIAFGILCFTTVSALSVGYVETALVAINGSTELVSTMALLRSEGLLWTSVLCVVIAALNIAYQILDMMAHAAGIDRRGDALR